MFLSLFSISKDTRCDPSFNRIIDFSPGTTICFFKPSGHITVCSIRQGINLFITFSCTASYHGILIDSRINAAIPPVTFFSASSLILLISDIALFSILFEFLCVSNNEPFLASCFSEFFGLYRFLVDYISVFVTVLSLLFSVQYVLYYLLYYLVSNGI